MEHHDVLIVGAGLSGIGAAKHLQDRCPGKRYAILEGRAALGGTWDIFRYPGIRSDSDMHTLGYSFKPWISRKAIAEGPAIRGYIRETAAENGIDRHIRYHHLVELAEWHGASARWTLTARDPRTGERRRASCNFLFMCAGYYSYKRGHDPEFAGREDFRGDIVHPQFWPERLDYRGKKVVVIGSGATAVTLVPALADSAAHVTMLQRSPTWMISLPWEDRIANALRKLLPASWAYAATRWKNTLLQQWLYRKTRKRPRRVREILLRRMRRELGPDYDIDTHLTPSYDPWDQRLCLVPGSDFFKALKKGAADIVTERIERFSERGILLESGRELEADLIVTATGLELVTPGELAFRVDGEPFDFARQWSYKGLMVTGLPNCVSTFGYINASWTLRADITAEWACRLLEHMDARGASVAVPALAEELAAEMPRRPWIDGFSPGYMRRAMPSFPSQGDREPWLNPQDYLRDRKMFRKADLDDGNLRFGGPTGRAGARQAPPGARRAA